MGAEAALRRRTDCTFGPHLEHAEDGGVKVVGGLVTAACSSGSGRARAT